VRNQKSIDIVVKLVVWHDDHFYDRMGLDEKSTKILDVDLPYLILPVKPGRDVVLLLETIALNHRLKGMGYHSAQEFTSKLLELTTAKSKNKRGAL
jgi:HPr kinase/phosphorylase